VLPEALSLVHRQYAAYARKEDARDFSLSSQGAVLSKPSVDEMVQEFDEYTIVEAAKRGDQDALARLYEHYFPRVYRYVSARLGRSEDAEDVTTEVFLRVIDNIGGFTWRGLPFGAWLFRIARNELVSHVRRERPRTATAELTESIPDPNEDHVTMLELQFAIAEVSAATNLLSEAQRQVIALRFGAGLSVAETAQALKKTENTVKVLQHKAIARLQKLVTRK
jgi:RNA polymerase sigma-70 factor, ECF subfamily